MVVDLLREETEEVVENAHRKPGVCLVVSSSDVKQKCEESHVRLLVPHEHQLVKQLEDGVPRPLDVILLELHRTLLQNLDEKRKEDVDRLVHTLLRCILSHV